MTTMGQLFSSDMEILAKLWKGNHLEYIELERAKTLLRVLEVQLGTRVQEAKK